MTNGRPASSTDARTWTSYTTAKTSSIGAGLGFVLNGDGISCIDLDHCITDGTVAPWALAILKSCPPTYVEISPSSHGLHIWGRSAVASGRRIPVPGGVAEIYSAGRYITVTSRRHGTAPMNLADITAVIKHLIA